MEHQHMNRAMLQSEPQLMTIMECVDLSALFPPSLDEGSQTHSQMDINGPSRSNSQLVGWKDINKDVQADYKTAKCHLQSGVVPPDSKEASEE